VQLGNAAAQVRLPFNEDNLTAGLGSFQRRGYAAYAAADNQYGLISSHASSQKMGSEGQERPSSPRLSVEETPGAQNGHPEAFASDLVIS
jgi:hypothetical protein